MAKLPVDLYDAVVEQLLPFMGTRDERQGELECQTLPQVAVTSRHPCQPSAGG